MSLHAAITQRVESVTRLAGAVESTTPPFPRAAKVELVARCDFDCSFCASSKHPRAIADMTQDTFQRLASGLRRMGVEELGLFYIGEPFLCAWLPEAVRYAKHVCGFPHVFVTTNGYAATGARVSACIRNGLDSLKFAFNWSGPEQLCALTRRAPEDYGVVLANLRSARKVRDEAEHETGHHCMLTASSLAYDASQAARMAPVLEQITPLVDEHYWLPLLGHAGPGKRAGAGAGAVPVKPLPCRALFTVAHITADARLAACPLDASPRFHMGDVERAPYTHAWRSPAFRALRDAHLKRDVRNTVCSQCIAYGDSG